MLIFYSFSGLHAVSITGWAKGADYRPGVPITSSPKNHSWNAVYIDGNWQLVDCHWATRSIQLEIADDVANNYDDFYFITDPAALIHSHLPENPTWQLLQPASSAAEFEGQPFLKSNFFALGLRLLHQNTGVLFTDHGILTLTLGFDKPAAFTYKISHDCASDEEKSMETNLAQFILQEMADGRVTYYFRAPRSGNYYLTIFAREIPAEIPKSSIVFKSVAEFKIISDEPAKISAPFPYCSDSGWGIDMYVNQYPMKPHNKTAILICPDGKAELKFDKEHDLHVYARLVKDGLDFDTLKKAMSLHEDNGSAVVSVALPGEGEYGLEIFANDQQKDGKLYTHFCQYLCSFLQRDFTDLYGCVCDRSDLPASVSGDGIQSLYHLSSVFHVDDHVDSLKPSEATADREVPEHEKVIKFYFIGTILSLLNYVFYWRDRSHSELALRWCFWSRCIPLIATENHLYRRPVF